MSASQLVSQLLSVSADQCVRPSVRDEWQGEVFNHRFSFAKKRHADQGNTPSSKEEQQVNSGVEIRKKESHALELSLCQHANITS